MADTVRLARKGTFQIPHYGSYSNNRYTTLPSAPSHSRQVFCIIIFGENTHCHPSAKVIQDLNRDEQTLFLSLNLPHRSSSLNA